MSISNNQNSKVNLRNPVHFLAFGFGSGLAPKMPGTAGTAAAIPLFVLVSQLHPLAYILVVCLFAVVGIYLCGKAAEDMGVHDHSGIVWDEIVGYLVTMMWVPCNMVSILMGFVLFRLFDIWKPWPISWCDRSVHGGWGIMLDDLLAGLFAAIVMQGLLIFTPLLQG